MQSASARIRSSAPLSHDDFVSMLRTVEGHLFRRPVCAVARDSLDKFFSSVLARLDVMWDDDCGVCEAHEAILVGEERPPGAYRATRSSSGRLGRATAMHSSSASTCSPRLRKAGIRRVRSISRMT